MLGAEAYQHMPSLAPTHTAELTSQPINNLSAENSTKWKSQACTFPPAPAYLPPARDESNCFSRFSVKDKVALVTGGAKGMQHVVPHNLGSNA